MRQRLTSMQRLVLLMQRVQAPRFFVELDRLSKLQLCKTFERIWYPRAAPQFNFFESELHAFLLPQQQQQQQRQSLSTLEEFCRATLHCAALSNDEWCVRLCRSQIGFKRRFFAAHAARSALPAATSSVAAGGVKTDGKEGGTTTTTISEGKEEEVLPVCVQRCIRSVAYATLKRAEGKPRHGENVNFDVLDHELQVIHAVTLALVSNRVALHGDVATRLERLAVQGLKAAVKQQQPLFVAAAAPPLSSVTSPTDEDSKQEQEEDDDVTPSPQQLLMLPCAAIPALLLIFSPAFVDAVEYRPSKTLLHLCAKQTELLLRRPHVPLAVQGGHDHFLFNAADLKKILYSYARLHSSYRLREDVGWGIAQYFYHNFAREVTPEYLVGILYSLSLLGVTHHELREAALSRVQADIYTLSATSVCNLCVFLKDQPTHPLWPHIARVFCEELHRFNDIDAMEVLFSLAKLRRQPTAAADAAAAAPPQLPEGDLRTVLDIAFHDDSILRMGPKHFSRMFYIMDRFRFSFARWEHLRLALDRCSDLMRRKALTRTHAVTVLRALEGDDELNLSLFPEVKTIRDYLSHLQRRG